MNTHVLLIESSTPHLTALRKFGLVFVIWLLAALSIAVTNITADTDPLSRAILPLAVALPTLLLLLAYRTSAGVRDFVHAIDLRPLVVVHSFRMIGMGFVFLWFYDVLPAFFALPAGLGDAFTAAWALVLGVMLFRGVPVTPAKLHAWNTFGIVDFVLAVILGTLGRGTPLGLIENGVTTDPMGLFPLNLFPLFLVPVLLLSHAVIYLKLRSATP